MRITFPARIRAFLAKHGPATVDQVVAAVGKHVPATRAIRCYDRQMRSSRKYLGTVNPLDRESALKIEVGRRRVVMSELARMSRCGHLRRVAVGTYKIAG